MRAACTTRPRARRTRLIRLPALHEAGTALGLTRVYCRHDGRVPRGLLRAPHRNARVARFVSHIHRNADGLIQALELAPADTTILLETTAGMGTSIGASFEELALILERVDVHRSRFGVCVDTSHVWAAGYDLSSAFDDVFARFDDCIGLDRLRLFHLNDSATSFGSRRDRHADIGEGSIGDVPFRRIVTDDRFRSVPKVIETPKLPDVISADRRNLARLRGYRDAG